MTARRTPTSAAEAVLDVLRALAWQPVEPEPAVTHDLEYERYVAQPTKAGRHPMWDAMWAEATAHLRQDTAETA